MVCTHTENEIMKTYKFQLYNSTHNDQLEESIAIACEVYNWCISLHRRYYRLYGKYLRKSLLERHLTKKRRRIPRWQKLNSQAVQNVADRIELSYQAFFDHIKKKSSGRKRPPHFRKLRDYHSFTLKQSGYKFGDDNRITIMGRTYKFFKSREINGRVKTITVKKMPTGRIFIFVVTDEVSTKLRTRTGKAAGIDFGLKDFLVLSDGTKIASPEYLKHGLSKLRRLSQNYSLKQDGSHNKEKAYHELTRMYEKVSNARMDFFFKLANELCQKYDSIAVEDLNLDGMKRLWGRKVSDLAYGEFLKVLNYIALEYGVTIKSVDRFYPSSQMCSACGCINPNTKNLRVREWICPSCGAIHDRDRNAAINIRMKAFGI